MAGGGTAHLRGDDEARLLTVEHLCVEYRTKVGRVQAVSDVSFDLLRGETLGLVGESGCGKSTTGLAIMRLVEANAGRIIYDGQDLSDLSGSELRSLRPRFQMVFQDPPSSFNPRRSVGSSIADPLRLWSSSERSRWGEMIEDILDAVGLDSAQVLPRRPHQFSGGQLQRLSIARSLVLEPDLLVCDEPVASLDVSVQAQILNLLEDMKSRYGLTMIFIAHDLAVIKNISDRVAVMYLGKLCEVGSPNDLYSAPAHPYTQALVESVPRVAPGQGIVDPPLVGDLPSPIDPPTGCRFRTRCPRATDICGDLEPVMQAFGEGQFAACHHPLQAPSQTVQIESRVRGSR